MRRALALAVRARGRTSPNPLVGCVLVRDGQILAEGWHRRAGTDHAEAAALRRLGMRAPGATAYVTLEPHNFYGRTPPCTERLIAAGVRRVVVGMRDPNPRMGRGGVADLRRAGIAVTVGVLEAECRAINRPYLKWTATRRPFVICKAAVTLDGRLAAAGGDARWVSGPQSRQLVHELRDLCDAILVGAETVRRDDPALTTRLEGRRGRDPKRVILDGRLSVPASARAVPGALIATTAAASPARARGLTKAGAEVVRLPGGGGRVELGALLEELGRRELLTLLVEGGGQVHGELLAEGLADQLVLFIAPKLIGQGGVPLLAVPGPRRMTEAWRLGPLFTRPVGEDILVIGDVLRND